MSGHKAWFDNGWEAQERRFMNAILPETSLFINIGANHGFYVCLALARGVRTIAFEPVPENCAVLMRNVLANGWNDGLSLFPVAVSDRAGLAEMHGLNRTDQSLIPGFSRTGHLRSQNVPVHRLDDIIRASDISGVRVVVLVDAEGAEASVLRGAASLLDVQPKPTWLIEVLDMPPDVRGGSGVFGTMRSFGYAALAFDGEGRLGRVPAGAAACPSSNFVFCDDEPAMAGLMSGSGPRQP